MNSGSGSHTYGWGLYFADKMQMAQQFRNRQGRSTGRGHLYHAQLPDDDQFLEWDEPLSAQPYEVRTILEKNGLFPKGDIEIIPVPNGWGIKRDWVDLGWCRDREDAEENAEEYATPEFAEGLSGTGSELYRHLTEKLGSPKAASLYLRSIGIPGHRYENIHGVGGMFYVLYDADRVSIKSRED